MKYARIRIDGMIMGLADGIPENMREMLRIAPVPDEAEVGGRVTFGYLPPDPVEVAAQKEEERKSRSVTVRDLEAAGLEVTIKDDGTVEAKVKTKAK